MMKAVFLIVIFFFCTGCASTSTFSSYTSNINPIIDKIRDDVPINFKKEFAHKTNSADKILYLMEQARIAQIVGDIRISQESFRLAERAINQQESKAILSASGAVAQTSSILVNDNTLPYRTLAFEKVMMYHFQAMNYLYENDIQGAAVEIRKANRAQQKALSQHLGELQKLKELAESNKVPDEIPDTINQSYLKLDELTGKLKDSFQNAYTFYFSGIIYEMLGQANDAYIDYKKALEIAPDNLYVKKDVLRLAKQLNIHNELEGLNQLLMGQDQSEANSFNEGELIVFFEDDFVPQKEQIKIPVPVSFENPNFIALAFPIYNIDRIDLFPLFLYENGQVIAKTEPICNMAAIALKALKEKVPSIVVHQLIRAISKTILVREAQREFGDLGAMVTSAYNVISENADLRSWSSLPATVQIMRLSLPAGEHAFVFMQKESGANAYIKVNIKENTKEIIRIVRAGNKIYYLNLT